MLHSFFLRSSIGVAYVTVFNSSTTWAATFCLRGCMLVIFVFPVSIIHRTLTWTTGSLTCVRSYVCVYTQGWGTPTTSQQNILTLKNSYKFVLCSGRESNLWSIGSQGRRSTNRATMSPPVALILAVFSVPQTQELRSPLVGAQAC